MKKIDKKTLSLSTQTLRNLQADEVRGVHGGLPAATLNYSICWSCGTQGAPRSCCAHASGLPGASCSDE